MFHDDDTGGDETGRLAALHRYDLFGSPPEPDFDKMTALGAELFEAPICAIVLVAEDHLWLKSHHGTDLTILAKAKSFCSEAIGDSAPLLVADATTDPRFAHSELVQLAGIRAYAGAPLTTADGHRIGTFCVLDTITRQFTPQHAAMLTRMAGIVVDLFERRYGDRVSEILAPFAQGAHMALITTDAAGRVSFWNVGAEEMFGYSRAEMTGQDMARIVPPRFRGSHPDGFARVAAGAESNLAGRPLELMALRSDGSEFPIELFLTIWRGPLGVGFGAQIQDISERRSREEQLEYRANHDPLTGLLNRTAFKACVSAHLRKNASAAVIVFDLDGFKTVNDDLGHATGDALLQALALRTLAFTRDGEVVARLGGDEFALLLADGSELGAIRERAKTLLELINRPFAVNGYQLKLAGSVGIAIAPLQARDTEALLIRADLALFKAKNDGGSRYRIFDTGMEKQLAATRVFQDELRHAFAKQQFELHFQPQVSLADGRLVGAEALLRWRHPTLGLLFPKAFLSILETHALAFQTGGWVLDEACRTLAQWRLAGLSGIRMGVNLFAAQLHAGMLVETVETTLARHGLAPADLELEITETIALRQDRRELDPLRTLHMRGVGIAFDDFGTGFASLSALKTFPLSRLKIDRSFVQDVVSDAHSQAIIKGVATIGRNLGINVIAEGIETRAQAAALREAGCDAGQGFLYGRGVPADAFLARYLDNPRSYAPALDEAEA